MRLGLLGMWSQEYEDVVNCSGEVRVGVGPVDGADLPLFFHCSVTLQVICDPEVSVGWQVLTKERVGLLWGHTKAPVQLCGRRAWM